MVKSNPKPIDLWLAIGGVVVGIILFLLAKFPLTIATLLGVCFFLLLHPAWNFWWIEVRRWRQVTVVALLAGAIAIFGVCVWPSEQPISVAGWHWLVRCAAYARGLPWGWIVFSLTIGALAMAGLSLMLFRRQRLIEKRRILIKKESSKVEILSPLDLWTVGWCQTVSGRVCPAGNLVQVLVRPPDSSWHVQAVRVNGGLWTARCQFGEKEKPGMSYKIVAVLGDPLKQEKYDELPPNLTRSEIITVNRNSNDEIIDCPDEQLHRTRINDKNAIKKLVKVCFVRCEPHIDVPNDERQFVDFRFCIVNLSLFEVSIESVLGYITFIKVALDEAIKLEGALKVEKNERALNRGFRSEGWFTVRQYVPDYQVRAVAAAPKES